MNSRTFALEKMVGTLDTIHQRVTFARRWSQVVSQLFFLTFTSPILSPSIGDKTIYLYWIIPLLDPNFDKYIFRLVATAKALPLLATCVLIVWFSAMSPLFAVRWILILWPLSYLEYSFEHGLFFLQVWMALNVLVAVAQAIAYFINPGIALSIAPGNIAQILWGPYATRTYNNFYSIVPGLDLPRFSGLSREGGFFAALIAGALLFRMAHKKKVGPFLYIGVGLSLSKSTLFLAIGWLTTLIALNDRRTPAVLFLPFLLVVCLLYFLFLDTSLMTGQVAPTFTHRLFGYSAIFHDMDIANLILGNKASPTLITQFKSFQLCRNVLNFEDCLDMSGFAAIIFAAGIVGICLYLWQLSVLGITFWGVLIIFFLTSNVSPLSSTSFVVLSYFLAIRASKVSRQSIGSAFSTRE